jgi:PAS domain S-box-containing protein
MRTPEESRPDAPAHDFAPYLAEASEMLASSLDYQATLTSLAHLAVPRLADWCAIDMLEEDGSIKLLAVTHKDPGKGTRGRELRRRYPPDPDAPQGVPGVLRSGKPEFYPEVTDEMLVASARDAEHLHIMREVGFTSVMILPLVARGRTLGTITLVLAESGRRYEDGDLALAEALAHRAALAVDNARLYSEAQREIAERERVEKELRGSWSQLEVILRGIADGVTAQDPTGRVIYANEMAARTLGYPSARAFLEAPLQEVMQRFEVFDESGELFHLEKLPGRRALQGEEGVEDVLRFRVVATGEERWAVVRAMPVFDEDGRIRLVVNIFHDVTEIKQAEEEVRRSEERFRSLVQHGSGIIMVVDAEGTIRYVSPAVKRVLGYEPEEMVGKSALAFVHSDDRQEAMGLLAAVSSEPGGQPLAEFRVPHKDGSWRYLEHTVNNLLDDASVGGIVVNQRDVTGRRRAHETRLRLAAIVESSDDAIIGKTLDGIITSWNEGAQRVYGYSAKETVGQPISMLVPPGRPEEIPAILESIRRGEKVDHFETVRETKDGRRLDVELTVSPIRNVAGDIVGAATIARDITERARAYELLERRVVERTHELSTLLEVSNYVASTLELEPLLGLILNQLRTVVDYTDSSLLVFDEEDLVTVSYRGPGRPEQIVGTRFPPGPERMILERPGHMKGPIIIDDVRSDAPLAREYRQVVGEERLGREFGHIRSWMGVPLVFKKQSIGLLALIHEEPGHYTERHAELVRTIANQAAIAIENARLYGRAQSAAALEERQRLARELHDSVSQALYGITLGSDAALTLLERDPVRVAEPLRYVLSLAKAGLAEMSALIFELRPESLENEGLVAALEKQAASLRARHEVEVHATLCEEPDVPLEAKEMLYRIGQEALHNTVKHARGGKVKLKLQCDTEGIVLEIDDDGAGFDPSGSFPGHLGLKSMRERAERLGGRLEIESGLGEGTRIRASVPTSR